MDRGDMVLLSDRVVRKGPTKKMIFERDEGAAYVAFLEVKSL